MTMIPPFHLAIPVHDVALCRAFYTNIFQCTEGRSDTKWVDFDFFGHQLVIHQVDGMTPPPPTNPVDGHDVPVPHFGVVLDWDIWHQLKNRLEQMNMSFIIAPYVRFEGLPGEQATMFFQDPSGNCIELKSFKDQRMLFAK